MRSDINCAPGSCEVGTYEQLRTEEINTPVVFIPDSLQIENDFALGVEPVDPSFVCSESRRNALV